MKRVLFTLGILWGENGITSHLKTLSRQFIQRGLKVAIAANLPSDVEGAYEQAMQEVEKFKQEGIQFFLVDFSRGSDLVNQPIKLIQTLKDFDKVIQEFQPDIIHCHSLSIFPYLLVTRFRYRVPFVSTCHVEPSPSLFKAKLIKSIHYIYPNLLGNYIIAISTELKKAFETTLGVPEKNVCLVHHGIDTTQFYPPSVQEKTESRKQFKLAQEAYVICLVGRLAASKGHHVLIKAMANLNERGIHTIALFAGKGYANEEAIIQLQAEKAGVTEQVHFLGFINPRQVLWASDVIVLPSRNQSEGFPLVIPEAMLCGVVPIRTPAAGAKDQIDDGQNGFIIPFDDSESLTECLKQLFEDHNLRSRLSSAAIATAQKKFTVNSMITNTIAVYHNACTP
jgi:glycosyltransferase involved in cell wall biosynthesis